ncbi:MAG: hypothetical protein F6K24_53440 [Okeania sp. SIO2D1]|nr:hypothetical protein [Okeania sp. SIO2C9]NES73383.1 hypothetical protein [Okeania sp. SIO2D1]
MELSDSRSVDGRYRQNKFGKLWQQTEVTVRLAIAYFNLIWVHTRKENTAAQRVGLSIAP